MIHIHEIFGLCLASSSETQEKIIGSEGSQNWWSVYKNEGASPLGPFLWPIGVQLLLWLLIQNSWPANSVDCLLTKTCLGCAGEFSSRRISVTGKGTHKTEEIPAEQAGDQLQTAKSINVHVSYTHPTKIINLDFSALFLCRFSSVCHYCFVFF